MDCFEVPEIDFDDEINEVEAKHQSLVDALIETSRVQLDKIKDHYRQLRIVRNNIQLEREALDSEKEIIRQL